MTEIYILLAAATAAGILIGFFAVIALKIHREEKSFSLTGDINDRGALNVRAICGVYTRIPSVALQTRNPQQDIKPLAGLEASK